jgi:spoIIIJ-associated protein
MEWVEVTGKTVAAAKDLALDRLGVAEDDAEFEILDEPRSGFLGRLKGEARVRARVRPTQARQKVERRDRKRGKDTKDAKDGRDTGPEADDGGVSKTRAPRSSRGEGAVVGNGGGRGRSASRGARPQGDRAAGVSAPADGSSPRPRGQRNPSESGKQTQSTDARQSESQQPTNQESIVSAAQVGEEAIRFMNGLVAAFGLSGTAELVEDGDDLEVRVHGEGLGLLVGPRGSTLQAVQDLARVAAQRRLGDHDTRLRVDVGGYRQRRKEALGRFAQQMAAEVKESGIARVLEPMSSADRKVIHDVLGADDGVATRSEGEDPFRRIVIAPANA